MPVFTEEEIGMIEFVEKERYYDNSLFTGDCYMYPTYMLKDGKEYFMFNRREPDDSWVLEENEQRKKQLLDNEGINFRFFGFFENPFELIMNIAERQHHFTEPEDTVRCGIEEKGYLDFHGNLKGVSAAFFYRIYDEKTASKIKKCVQMLNSERWDDVMEELSSQLRSN